MENSGQVRKIIHVDMDMFYAAVELLDRPELRDKPVVVGGSPRSRSVVTTANYVARKFGIRSAMPCAEAYRRCPDTVFLPPDFPKYHKYSQMIRAILYKYTDLVEPLSLDEAYLDVTVNKIDEPSATRIAMAIKKEIFEQTGGLTASAGVAPNMFVAKIASDMNKPDGLTVVPPEKVLEFILPLPVRRIPGIGPVSDAKMEKLEIRTVSDLATKSREFLEEHFRSFGEYLWKIAQGIDDRQVTPSWERKSLGAEDTFARDLLDVRDIEYYLRECAQRVFKVLEKEEKQARTVTLKIKYHDFRTITRRKTIEEFIASPDEIYAIACELLSKTDAGRVKIRLAGISLSNFGKKETPDNPQLDFPANTEPQSHEA
ncbi:MAG TPA: DNA polymerase IV [Acidobacteriota bacterium]|nr:DNA polymerase IV [Acidobacteriota bacterium]